MSVTAHRAGASAVPCFVLTVSDTRTVETDASGAAIAALLEDAGHTVTGRKVVKDDADAIAQQVRAHLVGAARALIVTGGTGITARDVTVDAVAPLFEKRLDGFGELFRALSFQDIGAAALLSRACAGVSKGRAIFLLPGSEAAVRLAMTRLILPELPHIVRELAR
jgi:molybdenum cofactor biosynthesis protein B